jgi:hypothetical protein
MIVVPVAYTLTCNFYSQLVALDRQEKPQIGNSYLRMRKSALNSAVFLTWRLLRNAVFLIWRLLRNAVFLIWRLLKNAVFLIWRLLKNAVFPI